MKISFAKPGLPGSGAVVVPVLEGRTLSALGAELDERTGGALGRAMAASRFEGKKDQSLTILAPANLGLSRVLLLGLGKAAEIDEARAQAFGAAAVANLASATDEEAAILSDVIDGNGLGSATFAAHAAFGARLRGYRFDKYRTKEKPEDKPALKKLVIQAEDHKEAKALFAPLNAVAEGVELTRNVVSEPANVIHPESFADEARKLADLGVDVEVLNEKQMKKLGMGALLGVGQGSERESQLVIMRWMGADKDNEAPVAFVGKGVTFDTGGISIKPAAGMEDMKFDMAGAGCVLGLMKALAGRKARVNAVGIMGLVENMPSGNAQRPGDVVTSMSGQTIEVINTDAEGRLVLADALWYCQDRFKPKVMIDLATLTGAIIISLGSEHAGLFCNDDDLAAKLMEAGQKSGETVWRMPMGDSYDKQIRSDIADMKNTGGREAGSITAAQFLKRFVKDVPWAHIDIAGTAWTKKDLTVTPKGATGFGVRLLDRLVADHYEDR
ncbi:leucyl aminopeptidase [Telmatospirillum sp. J64-1]|uniref:leucyl aminopeptidase n=1 Tax=Telmatospirillum sp. J64-1 TaxID=2502183 RepID=UPI00115D4509|nr:leucyl aminopeptidase [Telmatospirillum sp. J64-1]